MKDLDEFLAFFAANLGPARVCSCFDCSKERYLDAFNPLWFAYELTAEA